MLRSPFVAMPLKGDFQPPVGGGQNSEAEKEGFEPSRQGFSPPNALAGRRLQPLGHFSLSRGGYRTPPAAPRPTPDYRRQPVAEAGSAGRERPADGRARRRYARPTRRGAGA